MSLNILGVQQASSSGTTATTASLGAAAIGDLVVVGVSFTTGNVSAPTDSAGNTYTRPTGNGARNGADIGLTLYYSILTVASAGLTVTANGGAGGPISAVAFLIRGCGASNADGVNNADFSGTSTAWTVGPTTPAPSASSIFLYALAANLTQTACPDATGYNSIANGFTSGMKTNSHQETMSAGAIPIVMGYKVSSSAETPTVTLPTAAEWFAQVASFSISTNGGSATGVANATAAGRVLGSGTASGVANASATGAVMLGAGRATGSANASATGILLGSGTATGVANASATAADITPVIPVTPSVGSGAWIPLQGHPNPNSRRHGGLNRKQRRIIKRDLLRTGFGDTDARDVDKDLGQDLSNDAAELAHEIAAEIAAIALPSIEAVNGGERREPEEALLQSPLIHRDEFELPRSWSSTTDQEDGSIGHWLSDEDVEVLILAIASL